MSVRACRVVMAVAMLLLPRAAFALGPSCTVNSPTLSFGPYDPTSGSATFASAGITVTCTALLALSVPFTVTLAAGDSGSTANRYMQGSVSHLPYNVYTSGSYSTIWDNTTGVAGSVSVLGVLGVFSGSTTLTAFGRILPNQPAIADVYSDGLTITISY